jgi:hypothetical protein
MLMFAALTTAGFKNNNGKNIHCTAATKLAQQQNCQG